MWKYLLKMEALLFQNFNLCMFSMLIFFFFCKSLSGLAIESLVKC